MTLGKRSSRQRLHDAASSFLTAETAQARRRSETHEIGYVHIDCCEQRHAGGKPIMVPAIDRVCKFTSAECFDSAGKMEGSA